MKKLLFFSLMITMVYIGCENSSINPFQENPEISVENEFSFSKITTSSLTATFWIYVYNVTSTNPIVNVHRITSDWSEMSVTWNNFAGSYDHSVIGSFTVTAPGWYSVDISDLVVDWLNGTYPNYGILIEQGQLPYTVYHSSEYSDPSLRPYFVVQFNSGTPYVIQRPVMGAQGEQVQDAYIWNWPDVGQYLNRGDSPDLYTGLVYGWDNSGPWEKQSLLRFELPEIPQGCTLTPGYWKTHSEFGPAPYDNTWAQLTDGANTAFFLSGKSYYEVLWTSPAGNAYYILAHAYIAAELNVLNGTSIPAEVQTAWNAATELFEEYTPSQVAMWKGRQGARQSFITLASILDDYNNGITGPGHCY